MASTNTNWVYEKNVVTDKDRKALEKAKRIEQEELAKWRRYVKVNDRMRILVPCDENGNPTETGLRKIQERRLMYGLK